MRRKAEVLASAVFSSTLWAQKNFFGVFPNGRRLLSPLTKLDRVQRPKTTFFSPAVFETVCSKFCKLFTKPPERWDAKNLFINCSLSEYFFARSHDCPFSRWTKLLLSFNYRIAPIIFLQIFFFDMAPDEISTPEPAPLFKSRVTKMRVGSWCEQLWRVDACAIHFQ